MKDVTEKLLKYCNFTDETCYILLLISRKKENEQQTESEKIGKVRRSLIMNPDEIAEALREFELVAKLFPETQYRIYVSVNSRSVLKGMCEFQKKLTDMQYSLINGNREVLTTAYRLGSEWKSILAKKECRAEKKFLFDIDFLNSTVEGQTATENFKNDIDNVAEIVYFGESKNGYALVTNPFDIRKLTLPNDVGLKTDAYLYMGGLNY